MILVNRKNGKEGSRTRRENSQGEGKANEVRHLCVCGRVCVCVCVCLKNPYWSFSIDNVRPVCVEVGYRAHPCVCVCVCVCVCDSQRGRGEASKIGEYIFKCV